MSNYKAQKDVWGKYVIYREHKLVGWVTAFSFDDKHLWKLKIRQLEGQGHKVTF